MICENCSIDAHNDEIEDCIVCAYKLELKRTVNESIDIAYDRSIRMDTLRSALKTLVDNYGILRYGDGDRADAVMQIGRDALDRSGT